MRALRLADITGDAAWLRFAVVGAGQAGADDEGREIGGVLRLPARTVMWATRPVTI
jgi:hypothetical protein